VSSSPAWTSRTSDEGGLSVARGVHARARQRRREIEATGDPELESLYEELVAYPGTTTEYDPADLPNPSDVLLMQELRLEDRKLAFFCTLTTFGTSRDLTLAELTVVSFFPANPETAEALTAAVAEAERA
jgi:hypothetical protein